VSGRRSRNKGSRGELEVASVLQGYGFDVVRTPNSGGLQWRGDLDGLDGYVMEVKRCERLEVPAWMRQAYAAARAGEVPVVAFRRSARQGAVQRDPDTYWHVILPLEEFARLLTLKRPAVSERGAEVGL